MTYKPVDLSHLAANLRASVTPTPLATVLTIYYKAKKFKKITTISETVIRADLANLTKWLCPEIDVGKPPTNYINGPFYSFEIKETVEIVFEKELATLSPSAYFAKYNNYVEHVIHTILESKLY